MARILRDFGEWQYVMQDEVSKQKVFLHVETGQTSVDPPEDVLEVIAAENQRSRQPVYEPTRYRFSRMPDPGAPPLVESHEPLECFGESLMLLRGLLTPEECNFIIAQAEAFGLQDSGYSKDVRRTDRIAVMGEDLARKLFERAKPFLAPMEVESTGEGRRPVGARRDVALGTWVPTGLNPCFRVCRYAPGGFFRPHHDDGFDYSHRHLSLKTFMMYLNDVVDGGPTTFYKETQGHYVEPDRSKALHDVQPERGACVVFNQCICHDGGVVKTGLKYLLRTEVMYELAP